MHPSPYPIRPRPTQSGLGIASLVLGILAPCGGITALPAVLLGHFSLRSIRRSNGLIGGKGMAVAGLVLGYLSLIGLIGFLAVMKVGADASKKSQAEAKRPFDPTTVNVPAFPVLPTMTPIEGSKVEVGQVRLAGGSGPGESMSIRIYRPIGKLRTSSVPCVLVAPAGTNLLQGAEIGELDDDAYHDECLPYAEAGMIVLFYSIDGNLAEKDSEDKTKVGKSYEEFRSSQAGLINARNALEFALKTLPEIDRSRIFSAGHSSAGTLSLLFGEHESRLAGSIAYAPVSDVEKMLKDIIDSPFSGIVLPDLKHFSIRSSPRTHLAQFGHPVFLFQSVDDTRVQVTETRDFVNKLKAGGTSVSYEEVPSGGHYNSMIDQGIPAAIRWIKEH